MSKQKKSPLKTKRVLFDTQYDMCDMIYKKLSELMLSVNKLEIIIKHEKFGNFKLLINESESEKIQFYTITEKNILIKNIGYVPLNNISLEQLEDPFIYFICGEIKFINSRPEIYSEWFEQIKCTMQELLDEEKKYEELRSKIEELPIFSPTREVLIEK